MRIVSLGMVLLVVGASAGCASAPSLVQAPLPNPVRLDELATFTKQGMTDDAVIEQIEQRGAAFVLAPQDFDAQRGAGVSEGVLRYLQGRASGQQELLTRIQQSARYRLPAYSGFVYGGYGYLGYYSGLHYYGGPYAYGLPYYGEGSGYFGHHGRYSGSHGGGHHGGGHR